MDEPRQSKYNKHDKHDLCVYYHTYVQLVVSSIRSVSIIVRSASIIINVYVRIKFDSDRQTYLT